MSDPLFDIIFRGDIVFGQSLVDVKLRLAQLFKADAAKIDSLFTGRPVPLKRGLELAAAQKYRDALLKAGAQVDLVAVNDAKPVEEKSAPAPVAESVQAAAPVAAQAPVAAAAAWTLAPLGADLLQGSEKHTDAPHNLDLSAYSLRPEGGYLLDPSEQHSVDSPTVIAPDFGVAEVGADLVRADEKIDLPLPEIDVEDWDIAELGEDLLAASDKPVIAVPVIPALDVGLAPVGADLGQIKPNVQPVTPDISNLSLVE